MIKKILKKIAKKAGFEIRRTNPQTDIDWESLDLAPWEKEIITKVRPFTMTSRARIISLIRSVEFLIQHNVQGSLCECGVWQGGSVLAMALTLIHLGVTDRDLYLYDNFVAIPGGGPHDVDVFGTSADVFLEEMKKKYAFQFSVSVDEVKQRILATGYPENRIHIIQGIIEETIPETIPEKLALLRLDCDWYDPILHCLTHLFPLVDSSGILIIDDYGHWKGCQKAVDEYFAELPGRYFSHRVDFTCRLMTRMYESGT